MATQARIVIRGENQLKAPLKQAQQDLTGFEKVANQVGDTLKKAFTVAAIVKGLQEVAKAVAECVSEFKEQIEVETKLDAVIKATGQQYKYTTKEIKDYASSLSEVTRFGDEVVESSAQLLVATQKFSKEGLERTLELSADLAEAMGTDLTSATSTLSKALIEPGEGLNRLKSVGISFTDAEEDMIKKLNEAGKEFEAQQMILDKVEKAYGGVAESIASIETSKLDQIKKVWGDLKQDLGDVFVNTLGPVFDWIYKTLRWLERLASQVSEKANFNKWIRTSDTQKLADNFTEDYLNKALSERLEKSTEAYNILADNYWLNHYLDEISISLDEFLRLSTDQRTDLILKLSNNDATLASMVNQQVTAYDEVYDEIQVIVGALKTQHEDQLKWEAEFNHQSQVKAWEEAAKGLGDVFKNATYTAVKNYFSDNPITVDGVTGISVGNTFFKDWLGTGVSDSTYMSTMYGDIGMWFQTTQAFMETFYEWESDFDVFVRKFGEPNRTGGGFNFGINSGNFGLTKSSLDFSSTMALLGPNGVKNLGFNSKTIYDALTKYGSLSKTLKIDNLNEEIERLTTLQESTDGQMFVYYQEMIDGLNDQLDQLTKIEKGTFLDRLGDKVGSYVGGLFGADTDQSKAAGAAIIGSFTSSMGEAGEVVSRLATNMATMGPLLGAIVTALHYVIEGLMENLKDIFNDFIQWGIEPLREFGRMIGQILKPILQEIMPSVIASGKVLMQLFQALARLLTPIVQILMRTIGPILSVFADVLVTIVGTISWAIDWLAYCITWVLNKVSFGWIEQTAKPGGLSDYLNGMYADPTSSYTGSESLESTGAASAAYSGGTIIHVHNDFSGSYIVGNGGMRELALIIRNTLEDVDYAGQSI